MLPGSIKLIHHESRSTKRENLPFGMYSDSNTTFHGLHTIMLEKGIDVMILKKAGLTQVNSLRTIVLFHPDCNYALKFIGREIMFNAERNSTLAPEQYGS